MMREEWRRKGGNKDGDPYQRHPYGNPFEFQEP